MSQDMPDFFEMHRKLLQGKASYQQWEQELEDRGEAFGHDYGNWPPFWSEAVFLVFCEIGIVAFCIYVLIAVISRL